MVFRTPHPGASTILLQIPPEEYVYLYFGFIKPYKGVEA